jgi:hypothetical protein
VASGAIERVSDRDGIPLLDRLTDGATAVGDDPRVAQFVRGVALGALVGAAIAGSTIWGRRRGGTRRAAGPSATPLLSPPHEAQSDDHPGS